MLEFFLRSLEIPVCWLIKTRRRHWKFRIDKQRLIILSLMVECELLGNLSNLGIFRYFVMEWLYSQGSFHSALTQSGRQSSVSQVEEGNLGYSHEQHHCS